MLLGRCRKSVVRGAAANAVYERDEVGAILIGDGGELQAQPGVGKLMLDDSFGANLAFGNKKIHSGFGADRPWSLRRDK
jgi:hypothetical protein